MVEDDLTDIHHELTVVNLFDGGIRQSTSIIVYSVLLVLIAQTTISLAIEEGSLFWFLVFTAFTIGMTWVLYTGWRDRIRLFIDRERAVLKGGKITTEVIEFGPQVEADIRMHKDDTSKDGWGGFYGMTLKDADTEILIASWWPYKKEDVRAFWPDFVRLVRAHGMKRGPFLAKVLEMADTGGGELVLDPRLRWKIVDDTAL